MNRLMRMFLIPLVVSILTPTVVRGATLTVCSPGCNYNTIDAAYANAQCGDTIEVRDSRTYSYSISTKQNLLLDKSCTSGNELILQAQVGQNPRIQRLSTGAGSWIELIRITGNYNIISGFTIGELGRGNAVQVHGDNNIVENNIFVDICTEYMVAGTGGEGIRIAGGNYNVIRNNTFGDAAHSSILLDLRASKNQILNNHIDNNYGHGISVIVDAEYNLIDGNTITSVGTLSAQTGKSAIQISGASNNSFRRNIIYSVYNRGVELSSYSSATSQTVHNWIYNNTFYDIPTRNSSTGNNSWVEMGSATGGPWTVANNKFYNNIVDKIGQQINSEWIGNPYGTFIYGNTAQLDAGSTANEVININDWNGNILKHNAIRVYFNGGYQLNYDRVIHYNSAGSALQLNYSVSQVNGKGSMSGNVTDSPMFVGTPGMHNWWYLQDNSTLIDAGIVVNDPNASIGGWANLTHLGTAPDIGAFESPSSRPLAPLDLRIISIN